MEQFVDYLNFGQKKMQVPDREAKQIRNHPLMTQADFLDMQEDQEKLWEEQKKHHQSMELARTMGMSATQFHASRQPIALPDRVPNTGCGGGSGGGSGGSGGGSGGGTGLLFGSNAGYGSGTASSSGYAEEQRRSSP